MLADRWVKCSSNEGESGAEGTRLPLTLDP